MPNPIATMITNLGTIKIELYADKTPQTVKHFADLAASGFYDGVKFHRVIEGFMAQGGDPLTKDDKKKGSWGTGGPGYTIVDEFVLLDGRTTNEFPAPRVGLGFGKAGLLAMANTGRARSGGSQFFFTLDPTPHLNGKHTIFGAVVEGMKVVEAIGSVETDARDAPKTPVAIQKIFIEGDLPAVTVQKFGGR